MSHFVVGVFCENPEDVELLLAPYQENNMGDCPSEYLQFEDRTEEVKADYEAYVLKHMNDDDALMSMSEFNKSNDGWTEIDGRFGYFENPNAKWDWWVVGGRWSGEWKNTSGEPCDEMQIKDINWESDEEAYKDAIRFWEIAVEGAALKEGEEEPFIMWKPAYYLERYGDKETYAAHQASNMFYAFVTPDGKWHEQGEMGWFGFSNATKETMANYKSEFEGFVKSLNPEYWLVVVDCHI